MSKYAVLEIDLDSDEVTIYGPFNSKELAQFKLKNMVDKYKRNWERDTGEEIEPENDTKNVFSTEDGLVISVEKMKK